MQLLKIMKVKTLSPLMHDGVTHAPGEFVDLPEQSIDRLLILGVVELVSDDLLDSDTPTPPSKEGKKVKETPIKEGT